jgi:hypothetical protein
MTIVENSEFREVAHSGGQVIFTVVTRDDGGRSYQITFQGWRPVPAALFAIYASPEGIPAGPLPMGGIGRPWPPPQFPSCVHVLIASDSKGRFGQECPTCNGYWRARAPGNVCPYCAARHFGHELLTKAQRSYVEQYCVRLREALDAEVDGDHLIDLDAVADAIGAVEKPPFYYAEQSQQNKFTCDACGQFNDILGTFGYCSHCGTRNDLQELESKAIPSLRARVNSGGPYEACAKDAVATFDTFAGSYARQLARLVPMKPHRAERLYKYRFFDLRRSAAELDNWFDIDLFEAIKADDVDFVILMFHRRHVYEHLGGEADEKYIADSGDVAVRPKQALRETQESLHRLIAIIARMATNLHNGFHEIIPPEREPIEWYEKQRRGS